MSQNEIKVITVQEAKQQINCFGYPLAIFFFLFTFLRFGIAYIPKEYRPQNIELVALAISISSTVLFIKSAVQGSKKCVRRVKLPHEARRRWEA